MLRNRIVIQLNKGGFHMKNQFNAEAIDNSLFASSLWYAGKFYNHNEYLLQTVIKDRIEEDLDDTTYDG